MRKLRMSELNRLSLEEFLAEEKHKLIIVLDNVRSLLNVGSVFRTADAFKAEEILLLGVTPEPNAEMRKTALGATEALNWQKLESGVKKITQLKASGYHVIAVEQTTGAIKLQDWQIPSHQKCLFIFGNEVSGVSDQLLDLCDEAIEIPQYGTKHSLNISVSSGIVMWEYIRQLKS